jgi:hypothetical protein
MKTIYFIYFTIGFAFIACDKSPSLQPPADAKMIPVKSFRVGPRTVTPPVFILDAAAWKEGGSVGLELKDSSGEIFRFVEYYGVGNLYEPGSLFWGTMNPANINPTKRIEDQKICTAIWSTFYNALYFQDGKLNTADVDEMNLLSTGLNKKLKVLKQ